MRTAFAMGLGCVLLSGCNALGNARTNMKAETIFGPKHSTQMFLGRCDAKAEAYDCKEANRFLDTRANFRSASIDASTLAMEGKTGEELKPAVQRYLRAGVAVADLHCEVFFQQIAQSAAHRQFLRSESNAIDGLSGALLQANGASASALATSNAVFALLNATGERYDAAYMVAPDLSNVEKLLERAQDEFLSSYGETIEDFYAAQRFLVRYSNNCTFNGLRSLVNRSIDAAEPVTDPKRGTQSLVRNTEVPPVAGQGTTP